MTTTYTVNGTNGTLDITFTAPRTQIENVLNDAVHSLFDRGYGNHGTDGLRQYSALTTTEKAAIVDQYTKETYVALAVAYKADADALTAKNAVLATAATNYGLG